MFDVNPIEKSLILKIPQRGKRKRPLRLEYETGRGNVRLPSERDALNLDEDLYEVCFNPRFLTC